MKNPFYLLAITLLSLTSFAQTGSYTITGKVVDAVGDAPMQGASVFAQNTMIGTATDAGGNFTLHVPDGGYDLVVTFTGYETVSRRITKADADDRNMVITVRKKENSLEDVVVKASNEVKDGWDKYGQFFIDNFIGETNNGKQCIIVNKEVLKFYFYKKRNRLKVLAAEPIVIENKALGYRIKYTLDSFTHEYGTAAGIYTGYPLFEELETTDKLQQSTWDANRLKAYKGSILHFMRSVHNKSIKEEGFEIQFVAKNKDLETAVKVTNFYAALNFKKDDSTQLVEIIPNQPDVAVLYNQELPDTGYLAQNEDAPQQFQLSVINITAGESIAIEQNGYYFDQNDITITGYWTWDKVGDMVPYDYQAGAPPTPSR